VTLLAVLTKLAWKPLLSALIARQTHIEHQLRTAEDSRLRAEKMLETITARPGIIQQAAEQAQRHQQEMAEKARQEVLAIRRRAQDEIESARARRWRTCGSRQVTSFCEWAAKCSAER